MTKATQHMSEAEDYKGEHSQPWRRSHQIKSALGNSGAFNPAKKNLNESITEAYLTIIKE